MQSGSKKISAYRVADILVLITLLLLSILYFWDAFTASAEVMNLILILPLTVLIFLLCVIEFVRQLGRLGEAPPSLEPIASVVPAISLFGLFVLTLPWLGFDVGTFVFVACFLFWHGERRIRWVIGYSLCFASLTALFFSSMLPYPMPMLLLLTEY